MDALASIRRALNGPRAHLARIPARPAGVALLCLATVLAAWMIVPRTGTEPVLVAAHDLAPGTELTADALRTAHYPPGLAPDDALTDAADTSGAVTGGAIAAGTPITAASLIGPDTGLRPEGTVLVPTVFGDAQAVSVIRPGHRLRVFTTESAENAPGTADAVDGGGEEEVDGTGLPTHTAASGALLEDAAVTAVQTPAGGLGQGTTVVTLAVTEEEAAALAREAGSYLSFALLN